MEDETAKWFSQLPPHGQTAYKSGSGPNVPLLLHVGRLLNYPGIDVLMEDVTKGFVLFGPLRPGECWNQSEIWTPVDPLTMPSFLQKNAEHVKHAVHHRRPDQHVHAIMETLLRERSEGKVSGPYQAPAHWGFQSVPLPAKWRQHVDLVQPLLPWVHQSAAASVAFAIVTEGKEPGEVKVRRGEDWRRSHHNSAIQKNCGPRHHTVDDLLLAARYLHHRGHSDIHTWSHDHESAYRQLLLANPELALILIITDEGPVIFMNHVLLFGATGSVFGYGRFSDFIMHMGRLLLLATIFHYVDDFTGIESAKTASSAFEGFESLNIKFGCRMKFEKRSPPLPTQHLLGVNFDVSTNKAIVAPTDKRREKLFRLTQLHLDAEKISPTEAGSLAGKASFFDSSCAGRVGRAATKPLFARQHAPCGTSSRLTPALRASLLTFQRLARTAAPRVLPLSTEFCAVPIIYADAFFLLGETKFRIDEVVQNKVGFQSNMIPNLNNGFGVVLFPVTGIPFVLLWRSTISSFTRVRTKRAIYFLPRGGGADVGFVRFCIRVTRAVPLVH